MKECIICKTEKELNEFRLVKDKCYRNTCLHCERKDASEQAKITLNYIQSLKEKCCICDYDKCKAALEFHHLNPNEKDFLIGSKGYTRAWDVIKQELDKCILVCANCHREIHAVK